MHKYENVSGSTQTLTATGNITPRVVEPGGVVTSDVAIENPNFKYLGEVEGAPAAGKVASVQAPQPNMVTDAQKIEPKEGEQ